MLRAHKYDKYDPSQVISQYLSCLASTIGKKPSFATIQALSIVNLVNLML